MRRLKIIHCKSQYVARTHSWQGDESWSRL